MHLDNIKRAYAEEIKRVGKVTDDAIINAFYSVPREEFVGPGPWNILPSTLEGDYEVTPNDNVEHLYHNVLVALDKSRNLNNGLPSWLAEAMQHVEIKRGDRVVHIGCGVGYYTAIMSTIVTNKGSVLGIEVDEGLAEKARKNLQSYTNCSVVHADGSAFSLPMSNAVFVNAGATHIQKNWVQALLPTGRLLVPLTYSRNEPGGLLKITNEGTCYAAQIVGEVYMYPCVGSRDDKYAEVLKDTTQRKGWNFKGEIRFDRENVDSTCWMQTSEYWLKSED